MWTVRSEENGRKCTNISSLFFCMGFIVLLFIVVIYSATNANLDLLVKGFDDCGNVCGQLNDGNSFNQCGPNDMRNFPKLQVDVYIYDQNIIIWNSKCVKSCKSGYSEIYNRCMQIDLQFATSFLLFFHFQAWKAIAAICAVAFILSYILLIMFRYCIKYVIWTTIITFIALLGTAAGMIWNEFATSKHEDEKHLLLIPAIFLTVLAVLCIILLLWYRNRIRLVAKLFKEASKALIDVPTILLEPVLTFLAFLLALAPFMYFVVMIETTGKFEAGTQKDGSFKVEYVQTFAGKVAHLINVIAFIWFTQFIFGCQHFIIAGTITKWYFARDKTKLDSPIMKSFNHLVFFHLGSVCLGSMIITLVKIIKIMFQCLRKWACATSSCCCAQLIGCCCCCLIELLDKLLKYLIRNAYIIVAMDGTPFVESGKRAYDLLLRNIMDVIGLNSFGVIVMVMGRSFIVGISCFVGFAYMVDNDNNNIIFPIIFAGTIAFLIVHCFISVFEMTLDAIFVSFCIDCEENDGVSRPYYMSEGLMKVMSELKEMAGGEFNFGPKAVDGGHP